MTTTTDILTGVVAVIGGNAEACDYDPTDPAAWTTCTASEGIVAPWVCNGQVEPELAALYADYGGDGNIPELIYGHEWCVDQAIREAYEAVA